MICADTSRASDQAPGTEGSFTPVEVLSSVFGDLSNPHNPFCGGFRWLPG